jgi:hypothetical protein
MQPLATKSLVADCGRRNRSIFFKNIQIFIHTRNENIFSYSFEIPTECFRRKEV